MAYISCFINSLNLSIKCETAHFNNEKSLWTHRPKRNKGGRQHKSNDLKKCKTRVIAQETLVTSY